MMFFEKKEHVTYKTLLDFLVYILIHICYGM